MKILRGIIKIMAKLKLRKDGTPDRRYKANKTTGVKLKDVNDELVADPKNFKPLTKEIDKFVDGQSYDPNDLHSQLLKDNNLKLDFDVLEGTISTKYGIIKLDKPTLVIKAKYVTSK